MFLIIFSENLICFIAIFICNPHYFNHQFIIREKLCIYHLLIQEFIVAII